MIGQLSLDENEETKVSVKKSPPFWSMLALNVHNDDADTWPIIWLLRYSTLLAVS